MTVANVPATPAEPAVSAELERIESRVLWLSTAIIDAANSESRKDPDGLKVGGHQASSASMVSIMTALWFTALTRDDRVSVKPHASPVLHAINFLLGELRPGQLGTLRAYHGLQSYPSRAKDPDTVDYSTGSVGIGATAELDEGAVWEAIMDPAVAELGELVWIVDFNRQSLDRVVPNISATRLQAMFRAAGWQVLTLKYGRLLENLFARAGGQELRRRIDEMTNPEYQRLLRCQPPELRARLPGDGPGAPAVARLLEAVPDDQLADVIANLGGHDLGVLQEAFAAIDDDRPTVIFAYTIKGHGLPSAGHPQNHSNLLTAAQMSSLAASLGMDTGDPWRQFPAGSPESLLCAAVATRLWRAAPAARPLPAIPADFGRPVTGHSSTQQGLGRFLLDLGRQAPAAARRVVTVAPDVASSTNLGGWLNKVGAWSSTERRNWFSDDAETILNWQERPSGQHIELGIAEVNLVGLLGELGPSPRRRSGSSSQAASPTSPHSPRISSGVCSRRCAALATPVDPRATSGCRRAPSTSRWPRCRRTRSPGSGGGGRSPPGPT